MLKICFHLMNFWLFRIFRAFCSFPSNELAHFQVFSVYFPLKNLILLNYMDWHFKFNKLLSSLRLFLFVFWLELLKLKFFSSKGCFVLCSSLQFRVESINDNVLLSSLSGEKRLFLFLKRSSCFLNVFSFILFKDFFLSKFSLDALKI